MKKRKNQIHNKKHLKKSSPKLDKNADSKIAKKLITLVSTKLSNPITSLSKRIKFLMSLLKLTIIEI